MNTQGHHSRYAKYRCRDCRYYSEPGRATSLCSHRSVTRRAGDGICVEGRLRTATPQGGKPATTGLTSAAERRSSAAREYRPANPDTPKEVDVSTGLAPYRCTCGREFAKEAGLKVHIGRMADPKHTIAKTAQEHVDAEARKLLEQAHPDLIAPKADKGAPEPAPEQTTTDTGHVTLRDLAADGLMVGLIPKDTFKAELVDWLTRILKHGPDDLCEQAIDRLAELAKGEA